MRVASLLRIAVPTALMGMVLLAAHRWLPQIIETLEALRGHGALGDLAFVAIYAAGAWLMLPASLFQGASGFLYGPFLGVGVSWVLSTASGAVSYELARGWLRAPIEARLSGRVAALDRAFAQHGLYAVILLRLSPIAPYNMISYALGVTGVPRSTYWLGTALGSLFPVILWTVVGASLSDLAALTTGEAEIGSARWLVLAATLVASVGIALFVRRALAEPVLLPASGMPDSPDPARFAG